MLLLALLLVLPLVLVLVLALMLVLLIAPLLALLLSSTGYYCWYCCCWYWSQPTLRAHSACEGTACHHRAQNRAQRCRAVARSLVLDTSVDWAQLLPQQQSG